MRPHLPALALVLLAVAVYGLAIRPTQAEVESLRTAERRARAERREARAELMRRERGRPRRAQPAVQAAVGPAGARLLRRRVLHVLEGAPVHGVVLEVLNPDPGAVPTLRLVAEGEFADLVALGGRLAAPETGLALGELRFTQVPGGLRLEAQGAAWSTTP